MSEITKPALPPRRPSPMLVDNVVVDSPLEQSVRSLADAPPRLPPRKSGVELPPIMIHDPNEDLPANIPMSSNLDINPPTAITVTPATPSTPIQHSPPPNNGVAQEDYRATFTTPGGYQYEEKPVVTPVETVKEAITAQVEAAKPFVAEAAQMGKQFEWGLITSALVLLAWLQVSLLWVILLGALAVLWMNARPEQRRVEATTSSGRYGPSGMTRDREAVTWV
jgi:hypothetical protein